MSCQNSIHRALFTHSPRQMINEDHSSTTYDCDDIDLCWLEAVNKQKKYKGQDDGNDINKGFHSGHHSHEWCW